MSALEWEEDDNGERSYRSGVEVRESIEEEDTMHLVSAFTSTSWLSKLYAHEEEESCRIAGVKRASKRAIWIVAYHLETAAPPKACVGESSKCVSG